MLLLEAAHATAPLVPQTSNKVDEGNTAAVLLYRVSPRTQRTSMQHTEQQTICVPSGVSKGHEAAAQPPA